MDLDRRRLLSNASRLLAELHKHGFDTAGSASQIVPVVIGNNEETLSAAEFLQHEGFGVRAVRPPTVPDGKSRMVVLNNID